MTWVSAVWLEVNNGENYDRKMANLLSLTMEPREKLEALIKVRAGIGAMSALEVMDWVYNHYLKTGELPS